MEQSISMKVIFSNHHHQASFSQGLFTSVRILTRFSTRVRQLISLTNSRIYKTRIGIEK